MRNKLSLLVLILWSTIILIIVGISYMLIVGYFKIPSALPSPTLLATLHPTATPSPLPPTYTLLPPSPTSTPAPTSTPTLPQPQVIGYSVADRPLELYQFGNGQIEKMIVAGIHGGYEWNTIALADELIDYLETHPEVIPADHTLYILRALNPDGYERSLWRSGSPP